MRHSLFAGIVILLGGCTLADKAATQEQSRQCANTQAPATEVATACTALIDAPGASVETLLFAHFNRGVARRRSNDRRERLPISGASWNSTRTIRTSRQ